MNWRWMLLDHVPPEIRLSRQERRQLTRAIRRVDLPLSLKAETLGFGVGLGVILLWFAAITALRPLVRGAFGGVVEVLLQVVFWVGLWLIFAGVAHCFRRRHTYRALREMGYEICESCGYWLRELRDTIAQCPECGSKREPMPKIDALDRTI